MVTLDGGVRVKKDEQFGSLANFQFSTSAMLFSEFDSLVGYRTGRLGAYESLYNLVLGRFFEASVCIMLYGVSVPSLHKESTDSLIETLT